MIGCKRPARSKGYCSAHYQKLRLLIRTDRRPADWVDDAPPQSAQDVKLPRGRAAAREREPAPVTPKEPPKPKAWVRKKGSAEHGLPALSRGAPGDFPTRQVTRPLTDLPGDGIRAA